MKRGILIMIVIGAVLLFSGTAGAQILPAPQNQILLPGANIPKFVTPLPVAGDITVVDATLNIFQQPGTPPGTPPGPGPGYTPPGSSFVIAAEEFQAQILPPPGPAWLLPPTCNDNNASWVWGYRTPLDTPPGPGAFRKSYLGPVVVAQKGVPFYPNYTNSLPEFPQPQNVLVNLPVDMTLDWANPNPITDCLPDPVTGDYTNPACGVMPPYTGSVPIATHLHGGEVAPAFDGGPDAWFTPGNLQTGMGFPGSVYTYPNEQQESTIWFHDHALGITRLNVYAGLAGVYPIIDVDPGTGAPGATHPAVPMPKFPEYDIPLIIQDRSFDTNCEIFYNLASNPQPNPTVHPFWIPEFIGDTIVVNGKTWPFLDVEPRQYRFRFVNGSNARFYDLTLNMVKANKNNPNKTTNTPMPMIAIATDDGYLLNAVSMPNLIIGPGERYEVIVDFTQFSTVVGGITQGNGTIITMMNAARTPFPGGAKPVPGLTDTVMQFRVNQPLSTVPNTAIAAGTAIRPTPLEKIAQGHVATAVGPPLGADPGVIVRQLTLNEVIGAGGPLELVVNNSKFNQASILPGCTTPLCRETELPAVGDTEIWEIINITADAHPMHTHLVSFQLIDRTPFQAAQWINQYDALLLANGVPPGAGPPNQYNLKNLDGAIGGNPAIGPFLQLNKRTLPLPYEAGWKDTVITYPGEVTRIVVRWATTNTPVGGVIPGQNTYNIGPAGFDPTVLSGGVGYVWHCHIIDHEDNEMMRNYVVGTARQPVQ